MDPALRPFVTFLTLFCLSGVLSAGEDNPFAEGGGANGENPFVSRENAVKNALGKSDGKIDRVTKIIEKDTVFETVQVIKEDEKWVIKPGVTLRFMPQLGLVCRGVLEAVGTREKPICFTARDETKGWGNICVRDSTADGSQFVYCRFSHGRGVTLLDGNNKKDDSPSSLPDRLKGRTPTCGGAFFIQFVTDLRIEFCRFEGNSAQLGGAIMFFGQSHASLKNNLFVNNLSSESGGAIECMLSSSPDINGCYFEDNRSHTGAVLHSSDKSHPTFTGNYISKNGADHSGGAIACRDGGSATFVGNYIADNTAKASGGAAYASGQSGVYFEGNYLGDNVDVEGRGAGLHAGKEGVKDASECIVKTPALKEDVLKNLEKQGVLALPERLK